MVCKLSVSITKKKLICFSSCVCMQYIYSVCAHALFSLRLCVPAYVKVSLSSRMHNEKDIKARSSIERLLETL